MVNRSYKSLSIAKPSTYITQSKVISLHNGIGARLQEEEEEERVQLIVTPWKDKNISCATADVKRKANLQI